MGRLPIGRESFYNGWKLGRQYLKLWNNSQGKHLLPEFARAGEVGFFFTSSRQ